ncbi:tetratricopeptide repeat-containing sulfotransferase family protein [Rhodanobacter sp. DHG33]|uniref:tetratricopeptide repeat-containing sulfotransferase family protein n=1 Tax=Rhodanobacter sp. DHG33 TaxID=2775921 RepID=UPI00177BDC66|nr:tetratricopeptide repeat-containing sulfotransferase family protein [Rhodanobacter sp. DHG33]MBD8899105.1 sulfotransferase [Rhodanobacter sp. DHG33]
MSSETTHSSSLSPAAAQLLERARSEWRQRQFEAAERSVQQVLSLAPGNPDALRMLGVMAQHRGDQARAVDCFRRVLPVWPHDSDLHVGLGIALHERGEIEEAMTHLRRGCELDPASASAWFNLGEALWRRARTDEAIAALQRTLELAPAHLPSRLSLAKAQASQGQIDAAVTGFREVLRRDPGNAEAWFGLSNLNTVRFDATDTTHLRQALARGGQTPRHRELLGFSLAKALEDQGDYTQAFDLFRQANASRRQRVQWNATGERQRVEAIQRIYAHDTPAPLDPALGREVIFIVSVPRSGSTLVEQILASHPEVEGANEIKDLSQVIDAETHRRHSAFPLWTPHASAADWQRLGKEYLARTAPWRKAKPRFTDKSLVNWYLVGAALAMLPSARVVVVRRDPLETCLACFRQLFTEQSSFTCDLDEMADYCIDFIRLTRFWLERYPDRVFDLEYETLTAEPEPTTRRLLDFCGLPFDPACLEFHKTSRAVLSSPSAAQVRQPMRRDTARSARYGDRLDGLRQRLRDAGVLKD